MRVLPPSGPPPPEEAGIEALAPDPGDAANVSRLKLRLAAQMADAFASAGNGRGMAGIVSVLLRQATDRSTYPHPRTGREVPVIPERTKGHACRVLLHYAHLSAQIQRDVAGALAANLGGQHLHLHGQPAMDSATIVNLLQQGDDGQRVIHARLDAVFGPPPPGLPTNGLVVKKKHARPSRRRKT